MPEAVYHEPGVRQVWMIVNNLQDEIEPFCSKCCRAHVETDCSKDIGEEYLFRIGQYRCQVGCASAIFSEKGKMAKHLLTHSQAELNEWRIGRHALEKSIVQIGQVNTLVVDVDKTL